MSCRAAAGATLMRSPSGPRAAVAARPRFRRDAEVPQQDVERPAVWLSWRCRASASRGGPVQVVTPTDIDVDLDVAADADSASAEPQAEEGRRRRRRRGGRGRGRGGRGAEAGPAGEIEDALAPPPTSSRRTSRSSRMRSRHCRSTRASGPSGTARSAWRRSDDPPRRLRRAARTPSTTSRWRASRRCPSTCSPRSDSRIVGTADAVAAVAAIARPSTASATARAHRPAFQRGRSGRAGALAGP